MSERATCWSITINNPTAEDIAPQLPSGWRIEGQIEKGEEGTEHYQAMLSTPQVRFSAVKRVLPRAHIEIARNKAALAAYVHKEQSRVAEVPRSEGMTVFKLQDEVLNVWDANEFQRMAITNKWTDDAYLKYADYLVRCLIRQGFKDGIEFVAINPMWRTSWKVFGSAIVERYENHNK